MKKYLVRNIAIRHKGKKRAEGSPIELTDEEAEPLKKYLELQEPIVSKEPKEPKEPTGGAATEQTKAQKGEVENEHIASTPTGPPLTASPISGEATASTAPAKPASTAPKKEKKGKAKGNKGNK